MADSRDHHPERSDIFNRMKTAQAANYTNDSILNNAKMAGKIGGWI